MKTKEFIYPSKMCRKVDTCYYHCTLGGVQPPNCVKCKLKGLLIFKINKLLK